jgi:sugar phosphate isomerase/epimerase
MGSVPMNPARWTKRLTGMVRDGDQLTAGFTERKLRFVRKREKIAPLYVERARLALEQLAPLAAEAGVVLAVESRSRYEDVPSEREMLGLLDFFKDQPQVAYWHDFGHIQLKHNLGLLDHGQWLDTIRPRFFGGHVHDVIWPDRDHRTPFTGSLDFAALLARIPAGCPLVWELSSGNDRASIRDALTVWRAKFPERC